MLAIQNEISSIPTMGQATCIDFYVRLQTPTSELRDLKIRAPDNQDTPGLKLLIFSEESDS
jgi:hypothetical protein